MSWPWTRAHAETAGARSSFPPPETSSRPRFSRTAPLHALCCCESPPSLFATPTRARRARTDRFAQFFLIPSPPAAAPVLLIFRDAPHARQGEFYGVWRGGGGGPQTGRRPGWEWRSIARGDTGSRNQQIKTKNRPLGRRCGCWSAVPLLLCSPSPAAADDAAVALRAAAAKKK
jgi:hypothetical protein